MKTQQITLIIIFIVIPLIIIICELSRAYHKSNNTHERWAEVLVLKDTMSSNWTNRKGKKFNNIKDNKDLDTAPRVYIKKVDTLVFGEVTNTKYEVCKSYEDDYDYCD
tara:strand:- start:20 stop:343 length:324 start_codon:yes stop_codon:yes gene_type:complete